MAWVDNNEYPPLTSDWADVQEKVFTRWLNTHLRRREPPIELKMGSLYRGALSSGIILWELIDQIAGDKPDKRVDRRGKMRIHYINNINITLDFLTKGHLPDRKPLKFVGIGAEDICDMKKTLVAGFVWTIILRFQVADCSIDHFIAWLHSIGIMVRNLTSDWTDGTQLVKLINILRPGYIECGDDPLSSIANALNLSEEEFAIPQVIDAEDMAHHALERANFVYLSYYKQMWDELTGPSCRLIGEPKRSLAARKPCVIEVKTWDIENIAEDVSVSFTSHDGEVVVLRPEPILDRLECADGRTGYCTFTLVPPRSGVYTSNIQAFGRPMRKGPVVLTVSPAPWAKLVSCPPGKQGIPSVLKVKTANGLTTDDLYVELVDEGGRASRVPALFSPDCDDASGFNCLLVPPTSGEMTIKIYYKDDNSEIEGSGASFTVFGKPSVNWDSSDTPDRFFAGVKSSVVLRAVGHNVDSLDVTVQDADGRDIQVALDDRGDGTFLVQFTPETEGIHRFDIKADLVSVEGLPRDLRVETKPTATYSGPTQLSGVAMKPVKFTLNTVNLKPEEVKLNISDSNGKQLELPTTVEDNGDGTFTVAFTPSEVGELNVQIDAFNEDVGTLSVAIAHPPEIVGGVDQVRRARATKLFEFQLQGSNINADEIKVDVKTASGDLLPHPRVRGGDPDFVVSFVPPDPGMLSVTVWPAYEGAAPLRVDVAPIAKFIGETHHVVVATKPFSFQIQGADGISLEDIAVVVTDSNGDKIAEAKVTDNGDGTYTAEFTPQEPGNLQVFIHTCGDVLDTPLQLTVKPCVSLAEGEGSQRKAAAGRPFSFDLQGQKGLKAKHIKVKVDAKDGTDVSEPEVKENPDGSFTVTFVPSSPDLLDVQVSAHGEPTAKLAVEVVPTCHLEDGLTSLQGHASKPVHFNLRADPGLKTSDVHIDVKDSHGTTIPFEVSDNGDGTFKASFTPVRPGDHVVIPAAHGLPISKPIIADIKPLAQFADGFGGDGNSKHRAVATKPFSFDINADGIDPAHLHFDIVHESGEVLPQPTLTKKDKGTYTATFVPDKHGDVKVTLSTDGVPFDKSLDVEVAPIARFEGSPHRETTATKLFEFQLSAPGLTPDEVVIDIEGKVGGVLPHPRITDNGDGTFTVAFTPMACDELNIDITTNGQKFDTPLHVSVAPIASIIGDTKRVGTATKPVDFLLSAKDGLVPEDIQVDIVDENGSKLPHASVVDNGNGTFKVSFTPNEPGDLKVHVSTKGVLYDTPLEVQVRPTAKFIGGGRRNATATKPFDFSLGADQLKIEDVSVVITDANGNRLPPPTVSDNGDGTFMVAFTPMEHGLLSVEVSTHGEAIGSPMEVDVAPIARFVGDLNRTGHSTKPFEFTLDAPCLKPDDIAVAIVNEKGYSLPPPTITDNGDGTFTVSFVPMDPCQLTINVSTNGEMFDTPLSVNVLPTAKWKTPSVLPARATIPVNLKMQVEAGLTTNDLDFSVTYENGDKVESEIKDNGDGTFTLSFIPPVEGNINVAVNAHGDPIGDTRVLVAAPPSAELPPGDPLRDATQNKTFTFPLNVVSLLPNEVKVMLGDEEVDTKIEDMRDGTFNVSFVPTKVGDFPVKVMFNGKQVAGDPFAIQVAPQPDLLGMSKLEGARVAKPFLITLDVINLKTSEVEVQLTNSEGKPITNFKLQKVADDKMELSFVPKVPGDHTLNLIVDSRQVPDLPTPFPVAPKPAATLVGDKKRKGVEGKLFEFKLDTINLRMEDIRIEITDDKGEKIWREDALSLLSPTTSTASLTHAKSSRTRGGDRKKKGKEDQSESLSAPRQTPRGQTPRSARRHDDGPAGLIDTPGLKGLMIPGDVIIAPPELAKKEEQMKIGFVPWKAGKFEVKVTFEDVKIDLLVTAEPKPKTKTVEMLDQLGLNAGFKNIGDEKELLRRIKELREELIKGYTRNNGLAERHKEVEKTISLLVRNHTSIVAIDRARKKRQQGNASTMAESAQTTFHRNRDKMVLYGNLFYLLRTEPQYLARLTNLVSTQFRKEMSQLIVLTLFTNAFSPTQELMLLRLISTSVSYDIQASAHVQDFLDNSPSIDLIIYYNRRKEGRRFIKGRFLGTIQALQEEYAFNDDHEKLQNWVETFYNIIVESIDQLPYGIRFICNVIYHGLQTKYPRTEQSVLLSSVGYVVFYRFLNLCFIAPEDWGLVESDSANVVSDFKLNCMAISKPLKSLFTDMKELGADPAGRVLNPWIRDKISDVKVFLKDIVEVLDPEEHLKVSNYSHLGDVDESILIPLKEIVFLHAECENHKDELVVNKQEPTKDPLWIILEELAEVPTDGSSDKTQISLPLQNKFEIQMSVLERDFNLKLETINELLYLFMEYPNVNGETLLEIFLVIKHIASGGEHPSVKASGSSSISPKPADVKRVDTILSNLETLSSVDGSGLSKSNGYNDFIDDIREELLAKEKHMNELRHEIKQLTEANEELDLQKKNLSEAIRAFEGYLQGVSNELRKNFKSTTRKFTWKQLTDKKCNIIAGTAIPQSQQKAAKFEITHVDTEEFKVKGKVLMVEKTFKIKMTDLLDAKDRGQQVYDTEIGVVLDVVNTLRFLNAKFLNKKRKYAKAK